MKNIFRELLAYGGLLSVSYGVYQIHEPSAFIVAGGFLLWLSIGSGKK